MAHAIRVMWLKRGAVAHVSVLAHVGVVTLAKVVAHVIWGPKKGCVVSSAGCDGSCVVVARVLWWLVCGGGSCSIVSGGQR